MLYQYITLYALIYCSVFISGTNVIFKNFSANEQVLLANEFFGKRGLSGFTFFRFSDTSDKPRECILERDTSYFCTCQSVLVLTRITRVRTLFVIQQAGENEYCSVVSSSRGKSRFENIFGRNFTKLYCVTDFVTGRIQVIKSMESCHVVIKFLITSCSIIKKKLFK